MRTISQRTAVYLYPFLILVVVVASYHGALHGGFVFDDFPQIVDNPDIASWRELPHLFTVGVWHTEGDPGTLYRPAAFVTWLIEHSLVGLHPLLYHLDNIVLHFICSLLVFFIVRELLSDERAGILTALLFAAHPVHTEAVAWIACRMELMYSLCVLLAFWIFIRKPGSCWYTAVSVALFAVGLLSKETAMALPLILAVYMILYERGTDKPRLGYRLVARLLPYVLVSAAYLVARFLVIGVRSKPMLFTDNSIHGRFLIMARALYEYVRLSFLPFSLSEEYLYRPTSIVDPRVIAAIALVTIGVPVAYLMARRSKSAVFFFAWFLLFLLPVSNVIPSGYVMTERALYLPSLSACVLIGYAVSSAGFSAYFKWPRFRYAGVAVFLAVLLMFTALSAERVKFWRDQKTFVNWYKLALEHRIELLPNDPRNYEELGDLYIDEGILNPETEDLLKKAEEIDPENRPPHISLARLYVEEGRYDEALAQASESMRMWPGFSEPYQMAGCALYGLGRYDEADKMFDKAISIFPGKGVYYLDKAYVYKKKKDLGTAYALFGRAAGLMPGSYVPLLEQGLILGSHNKFDAAREKMLEAADVAPEEPTVHYYLGALYFTQGDYTMARAEIELTLKLRPEYEGARNMLKLIEERATSGNAYKPG